MYDIEVQCLEEVNIETAPAKISHKLDQLPRFLINKNPWPGLVCFPRVSFTLAYAGDCILIKFYLGEDVIRGENFKANTPVHEDSCVEFFISFEDDPAYYNLEVNCIGTCLFGYGKEKAGRKMIGNTVIQKIKRHIEIQHSVQEDSFHIYWQLSLIIPVEVFVFHQITDLKGYKCRVNFFKCGDKLPEPHYLSWKNIESVSPNFHLPEFFGDMYFN
jgi:hypothetical protein